MGALSEGHAVGTLLFTSISAQPPFLFHVANQGLEAWVGAHQTKGWKGSPGKENSVCHGIHLFKIHLTSMP